MTSQEISKAILELYGNDPDKWTQGVAAGTKNGNMCGPKDTEAVCWCIQGAALKVTKTEKDIQRWKYEIGRSVNNFITTWNDYSKTTFKDVVEVLNRHVNTF